MLERERGAAGNIWESPMIPNSDCVQKDFLAGQKNEWTLFREGNFVRCLWKVGTF